MADFFSKLVDGLKKTRQSIADSLDSVFGDYSEVGDDFYDEIEETLIMSDMGIETTSRVMERMKQGILENHIKNPARCREYLIKSIAEEMRPDPHAYDFLDEKSVVLVIGVNGVGKTTTIGKLAWNMKNEGKKVLMCAADTFRAAAAEQLETWAERTGVDIVSQGEGADPAAVVYDGVASFKSKGYDIMLCDTAGRLHNKKNLMDELAKIDRILDRELPDVHTEVLRVLDASTGQNAVAQAEEFSRAAKVSGIILTKLDGTAKGGIAVAISSGLNIPVKYVGVGEKKEDLLRFSAEDFVKALF